MATIKKLKVGDVVFSIERQRMGNTTMFRSAVFRVTITEIGDGWVMASWNGNPPRRFGPASIKKWRHALPATTRFG